MRVADSVAAVAGVDGGRARLFDLWSHVYDAPVVQWLVYRPVQQIVVDELRDEPARRIVDVGCGTGILAGRLAREVGAELVCGCDLSMGMLHRAAARGPGPWVCADGLRLPLGSGSVDAVVCTEAFHWLPDPGAALTEFRRIVRRGGLLVIGVASPRTAPGARALHAVSAAVGQPGYWLDGAALRQCVELAGFRIVRQHHVVRPGGLLLPTMVTVARAGS